MNLTLEQKEIVFCDSPLIFVSARAGTGKTTTLVEYVKQRKSCSFLYIVYNSSIKLEATNKFPDSVIIHTIHSLAYQELGFKYKNKLGSNLKPEDIFFYFFKDASIENKELYIEALTVLNIINKYCNSSFINIEDFAFTEAKYIDMAKEYWLKMIDEASTVMMTHDGYLKLYHLSNPILNYDHIMVDEAQDSNEVMLDIVMKQSADKIFVGDEHQRIYSFRGALNVFERNEGVYLTLTKSFRFGPEIASIANVLLSKYKEEGNLLEGTDDRDSIVGIIDKDVQFTVLTRTNAHLFDLAVKYVSQGKKIAINGDSNFNLIKDVYYLYKNQREKIKSLYINKFKDYKHLKGLVKNVALPEYVLLVKIVEKYGDSLLNWIELIEKNSVGMKRSDVILSTAHKAKGLEFVSVVIADDFMDLYDDNGMERVIERVDLEEINLLYVAVTRATHELELNDQLAKLCNL